MKSRVLPFLATAVCLIGGGCATMTSVDRRIEQNPELFESLPERHRALVRQGKVTEGMSRDAVRLAWGRPHETRQGSREGRSVESWVYYGTESIPVQTFGVGIGYGYGWGYCGPGAFPAFGYDFAYRDYVAARVEFQRGRVTAWERNRR